MKAEHFIAVAMRKSIPFHIQWS